MTDEQGFYDKYIVSKADGTPVDPEATYFVLRLDTDPAAREAVRTYAEHTPNRELRRDLRGMLLQWAAKERL